MVRVFSRVRYVLIALLVTFSVIAGISLAWNWRLMLAYLTDPYISLADAFVRSITLFLNFFVTVVQYEYGYIALCAVLIGIYIALLSAVIRIRSVFSTSGTVTGTLGMILGMFGTGCAACGTLLLNSLLYSTLGATFAANVLNIPFLPFIGIGLLLISIVSLSRMINKPPVCDI